MEERVGKRRRCGVKEEKREGGCVEVVLGGGEPMDKVCDSQSRPYYSQLIIFSLDSPLPLTTHPLRGQQRVQCSLGAAKRSPSVSALVWLAQIGKMPVCRYLPAQPLNLFRASWGVFCFSRRLLRSLFALLQASHLCFSSRPCPRPLHYTMLPYC